MRERLNLLNKLYNQVKNNFLLFTIFGLSYLLVEILWRGYTHWTMFFVGGICGFLIGLINERNKKMSLIKQCFISTIIVTVIEFISGCIINLWLGWGVWDYSMLPFNILGQVCLPYSLLWFILAIIVIKFDDWIREKINKRGD